MNNTGFYDPLFAAILFFSFTFPIFIHFLSCYISYIPTIKRPVVAYKSKNVLPKVTELYEPIVVNFTSKMSQQPKQRSKSVKRRTKPVKQTRPVNCKRSPEKSLAFVKSKEVNAAKVDFSKPQPEKNLNKNNDLIKESVKSLKTLGYKSGEVKQTLQNLCISNQFKNSESLIEAFFKSR